MCWKQIEKYFLLWISVSSWFVCSPVHACAFLCHLSENLILCGRNSPEPPEASLCFSCKDQVRMFVAHKQCRGKPVAHRRCCNVFTPFTQRELSSKEVKSQGTAKPMAWAWNWMIFKSFPAQTIRGFCAWKPGVFSALWVGLRQELTPLTNFSLWCCSFFQRISEQALQALCSVCGRFPLLSEEFCRDQSKCWEEKSSLPAPKWKASQCVMCPG